MEAEDSSDGEYPFSAPVFVLTHEPRTRRTRRSRSLPVTSWKRPPRHWMLRAGGTSTSSTRIVERRRVVTSDGRSTSLP